MNKQQRTYEEIISLQDKAIEALTQANAALVMALDALKKARAEHGFTVQLPGLVGGNTGNLGNSGPAGGYVQLPVTTVPNTTGGIQWSGGLCTNVTNTITSTAGMAAKTEAVKSLIAQVNSQKELAEAYISGFNAYRTRPSFQKGQDEVQIDGCVSVS